MKRTAFKPRTSTLKATSFKKIGRKEDGAIAKLRQKLKSKAPKMTPIRASARGEECTLRFPCCSFDPASTVWCHSNRAEDGKGMGIKARDEEGAYGCGKCHAWLDGGYAGHMPRSLVDVYFDIARAQSQKILQRKGLMKSESATDCESVAPSIKTIHGEIS